MNNGSGKLTITIVRLEESLTTAARAATIPSSIIVRKEYRMLEEWLSAARIKPAPEQRVIVKASDHIGPYILPFLARYRQGRWYNAQTGTPLDAFIVKWRIPGPHEARQKGKPHREMRQPDPRADVLSGGSGRSVLSHVKSPPVDPHRTDPHRQEPRRFLSVFASDPERKAAFQRAIN